MTHKHATEWEQYALIAHIAEKLGDTRRLGKKAVQKYVHLLQELEGVPSGYKFSFYTYGPYSSDLAGDLDILSSMKAISIAFNEEDNAYRISPDENSDFFSVKGAAFLKANGKGIERIISRFGGRYAKELELLSTIVFVARNIAPSQSKDRDFVLAKVRELKPKYTDSEIQKSINELRTFGYLPA